MYDRHAAKGRGENDMDTEAVVTEARQSRERPEPPDDEHPDDTEYECINYEAELQEELNWLGARKGKGKSKGAREKGKGKGKIGKRSGVGFWCEEAGHIKADCKKFEA